MTSKLLQKMILIFLLSFFNKAQAQQQQPDSLQLKLTNATNDTARMLALSGLYHYYSEIDRDSALLFGNKAMDIATKLHQPLWVATFLLEPNAYINMHKRNLTAAIKYANDALSIVEDVKNEKNAYILKDDEFAGDPHKYRISLMGGVFHQLGNIYRRAGENEKAISYYKQEIIIADSLKTNSGKTTSNMNIGSIYVELNKFDSALAYSKKALMYSNLTGFTTYNGYILEDIGTVYLNKGLTDSAKYYYSWALQDSRKYNNVASELYGNVTFAKLYEKLHNPDSVKYYAVAALQLAYNFKDAGGISTAAAMLSTAYKSLGNADSALHYLTLSKSTGDSLNTARNKLLMQFQSVNFEEQMRLEKAAQESAAYTNKIRTATLIGGLILFSLLAFVFYRNNRQKQKANIILEKTLTDLKSTQTQLIQSEKMASLGELTAGIAHEIQNPLNFVNNFSEVNTELIDELKTELATGNLQLATEIANDISENEQKINYHGKRADSIVKGMLQHSRANSGKKELTDLNALADEYLRLSYHGLRAKDKSFNATMQTDFDKNIGIINIMPQDMGRVLLNLFTNAFYSVAEKKTLRQAQDDTHYEPTVSISTKKINGRIEIKVKDNGMGIPQKVLDKIYQPFFTTKPTGQGTGLGLSMSYDIITKAHGGELKVETKEGEGAEFIIILPIT